MGVDLDLDDVAAGNPTAERELKAMRDELAMLRGALYDEQHGITATLREQERDSLIDALAAMVDCDLTYLGGHAMISAQAVTTARLALRDARPNTKAKGPAPTGDGPT